jgi:peptidoglycan/LPS O-acetylase OafA/YrhL
LAHLEGKNYTVGRYIRLLLTGGANPAYYYVIILCQFYLLSPLLIPLARKKWLLLLGMTALLQLTIQLLQYPLLFGIQNQLADSCMRLIPKWLFPWRIFWFSLGIVAGFHLQVFKDIATRFKWTLLIVLVSSFLLGVLEWEFYFRIPRSEWLGHRETLIDNLYALCSLLCFIAFDEIRLPYSKPIGELGTKSFGIYLIHAPVIEYTARTVYHLCPRLLPNQYLMQPALILVGLAAPLLLMAAVSRSPARRFYSYLFG